jgi:hypothetical protein
MMEDKPDGSSNFKLLEDKTSKEDLLWVIQKGVTMTYLLHEDVKDKYQPCAIGEIISTPSGMHLYIYYLYHSHEGNCKTKEPFAEVLDPEGSQCIQKNNKLEVKTPGLIIVIVTPLTYINVGYVLNFSSSENVSHIFLPQKTCHIF